jgi:hypothetical protein
MQRTSALTGTNALHAATGMPKILEFTMILLS